MMKRLTRYFIRGLVTLLPLFLSVYLLTLFLSSVENQLHNIFFTVFPFLPYIQGMGILLGIAVILIVGFAMSSERVRKAISAVEMPFQNVPIVKTIYSAMKDLTHYFSPKEKKANRVVLVRIPQMDIEFVGFVTRETLAGLPEPLSRENRVAVFLPFSYQLGGLTTFIPRDWIREIDLTVEQAMKSAVTAWMPASSAQENEGKKP